MVLLNLYRIVVMLCLCFFFKQKTAYEMRISDWSSDVCSSYLAFLDEIAQDAGDAVGRLHRAAETAAQHRLARIAFGRGCGCGAQLRHLRDDHPDDLGRRRILGLLGRLEPGVFVPARLVAPGPLGTPAAHAESLVGS